jgi:hypothetical protein
MGVPTFACLPFRAGANYSSDILAADSSWGVLEIATRA